MSADVIAHLRERKIDALYYMAAQPHVVEQRLYDKVWSVQRREIVNVIGTLAAADIAVLVFKGGEMVPRFYGEHGLGFVADCDLLAHRTDLVEIMRVLYDHRYRPAALDRLTGRLQDRDIVDIGTMEATHYELAPFRRMVPIDLTVEERRAAEGRTRGPLVVDGDSAWVVVEFDVHHAVAMDIDSSGFYERAVASALGVGHTFSDADHLWFTTSRYYTEVAIHAELSLRSFAYIIPLVAARAVDWDVLLAAARTYHLNSSLFYYLQFANLLVGQCIPDAVLTELQPTRGPRVRDWGWQLGKLFDAIEDVPFPSLFCYAALAGDEA